MEIPLILRGIQLLLALISLIIAAIALAPVHSIGLINIDNTNIIRSNMFTDNVVHYLNSSGNIVDSFDTSALLEYYTLGVWGYCGYDEDTDTGSKANTYCDNIKGGFDFQMEKFYFVEAEGSHNYTHPNDYYLNDHETTVFTPDDLPSEDNIKHRSKKVYGMLIAVVVVAALDFLLVIGSIVAEIGLTTNSNKRTGVSAISVVLEILAFAFAAACAANMKFAHDIINAYNYPGSDYGVVMSKGAHFEGMVYAVVALTVVSFVISVAVAWLTSKDARAAIREFRAARLAAAANPQTTVPVEQEAYQEEEQLPAYKENESDVEMGPYGETGETSDATSRARE